MLDPYTFSHVLHGLLFYAALRLVPGTSRPGLRFTLALALEAIWEILENTPMMIAKYREATISLDYFGDSIVNSVADIGACALGYLLARTIPARASIAIFITVEISMILWIRDSLLLNVLMLVWPLEAIRNWQMS